jgi:hypothetical protein
MLIGVARAAAALDSNITAQIVTARLMFASWARLSKYHTGTMDNPYTLLYTFFVISHLVLLGKSLSLLTFVATVVPWVTFFVERPNRRLHEDAQFCSPLL